MAGVVTFGMIENLQDAMGADHGVISPDQVRRVFAVDAQVNTSIMTLLLPTRIAMELGLKKRRELPSLSGTDRTSVNILEPVRLTIGGRECTTDPIEVDDSNSIVIGRLPLLWMDWVVRPDCWYLTGIPDHNGEQVLEL